mmetsp:Transcript_39893/g.118309  ORF Transcript_39893/g.118309 Transcript_39893/m.118309 type:complete len:223 (-) Transcript_39893:74-742(-)
MTAPGKMTKPRKIWLPLDLHTPVFSERYSACRPVSLASRWPALRSSLSATWLCLTTQVLTAKYAAKPSKGSTKAGETVVLSVSVSDPRASVSSVSDPRAAKVLTFIAKPSIMKPTTRGSMYMGYLSSFMAATVADTLASNVCSASSETPSCCSFSGLPESEYSFWRQRSGVGDHHHHWPVWPFWMTSAVPPACSACLIALCTTGFTYSPSWYFLRPMASAQP